MAQVDRITRKPTAAWVEISPPNECLAIINAPALESKTSKMMMYPLMRWNSIILYRMAGTNWKKARKAAAVMMLVTWLIIFSCEWPYEVYTQGVGIVLCILAPYNKSTRRALRSCRTSRSLRIPDERVWIPSMRRRKWRLVRGQLLVSTHTRAGEWGIHKMKL